METPEIQKLVEDISHFVNSYSSDHEKFITFMSNEHRTLQQSFTKLCLKWIEYCASDDYRYDGRNEASHQISRELTQLFKQINYDIEPSKYLPMI